MPPAPARCWTLSATVSSPSSRRSVANARSEERMPIRRRTVGAECSSSSTLSRSTPRYYRVDLDRHPEWQIGNAHGGAGRKLVDPVEPEDQVGETVDDTRLLCETRHGVDVAVDLQPARDLI